MNNYYFIFKIIALERELFFWQLEKAQEATDAANIRAAYATASANQITGSSNTVPTVTITQNNAGWESIDEIAGVSTKTDNPTAGSVESTIKTLVKGNVVTVGCDANGKLTLSVASN